MAKQLPMMQRLPGLLIWLRLMRVYTRSFRRASQQLRPYDLSMAQFDVLAHVGSHEGLTQQELAVRLFVTEGNVTQVLTKMEARDLLYRSREGRTKRILLTEAGRELYRVAVPEHERFQASQFDRLTADEQRQLLALLRKLDRP